MSVVCDPESWGVFGSSWLNDEAHARGSCLSTTPRLELEESGPDPDGRPPYHVISQSITFLMIQRGL